MEGHHTALVAEAPSASGLKGLAGGITVAWVGHPVGGSFHSPELEQRWELTHPMEALRSLTWAC